MYEYLTGELVVKTPTHVVVDVSGVGYFVHISLNTYSLIKDETKSKLYVSFQVREDAHTLFGFAKESERQLFENLISVSGIGPSTGRMMLSSLTPEEIQGAIVTGNVNVLKSIKGIGPKTAQRLILELQDKLNKKGINLEDAGGIPQINSVREEATSALVLLGFQKSQVEKCLDGIMKVDGGIGVESLIKEALRKL